MTPLVGHRIYLTYKWGPFYFKMNREGKGTTNGIPTWPHIICDTMKPPSLIFLYVLMQDKADLSSLPFDCQWLGEIKEHGWSYKKTMSRIGNAKEQHLGFQHAPQADGVFLDFCLYLYTYSHLQPHLQPTHDSELVSCLVRWSLPIKGGGKFCTVTVETNKLYMIPTPPIPPSTPFSTNEQIVPAKKFALKVKPKSIEAPFLMWMLSYIKRGIQNLRTKAVSGFCDFATLAQCTFCQDAGLSEQMSELKSIGVLKSLYYTYVM